MVTTTYFQDMFSDILETATKEQLSTLEEKTRIMRQRGPSGDLTEWTDELNLLQQTLRDVRSGRKIPDDVWNALAEEVNDAMRACGQKTDMDTDIIFRWSSDGLTFVSASCPKIGRPGRHSFSVDGEELGKNDFLRRFGFFRNNGNVSWGSIHKHVKDLMADGKIARARLIRTDGVDDEVVWEEGDDF